MTTINDIEKAFDGYVKCIERRGEKYYHIPDKVTEWVNSNRIVSMLEDFKTLLELIENKEEVYN